MKIQKVTGSTVSTGTSSFYSRTEALVTAVQVLYPPTGQAPHRPPVPSQPVQHSVEELHPISRPEIPSWLDPERAVLVPTEGELVVEGDCPFFGESLRGSVAPKSRVQGKCRECLVFTGKAPAGIDLLAYYLPFHFYSQKWGIYVLSSGVLQLAVMLRTDRKDAVSSNLVNLGYLVLMHHERFHFLSEMACARAELLMVRKLYERYYHEGIPTAYEEALANAQAFLKALRGQPPKVKQKISQWMRSQGPGYRDFVQCLTLSSFTSWCRKLTSFMAPVAPGIFVDGGAVKIVSDPPSGNLPTEFLFDGLARSSVPVRVVFDIPCLSVLMPFQKYAGLRIKVHCNDHPPPHIHVEMPPGTPITRVTWPALEPLEGDPPLSRGQQKALKEYVSKFEREIGTKIRQVYPLCA